MSHASKSDHLVNQQIVESVADTVTINSGLGPSQSASMLNVVMAETIGMSMYNAVNRQQSSSMVGSAAVTTACARMLQASPGAAPAPAPVPDPSTGVVPIPDNPGEAAIIAAAGAEAEGAVNVLAQEAASTPPADAEKNAANARSELQNLAKQIEAALANLPPAPAPTPTPTPAPPPPPPPPSRKKAKAKSSGGNQ